MKWTRRVPIIPIISRVHFGNRSQNNPIRNDPMEHGNALLQGIASPNNSTNQQPARLRFRWACFFTILWLLFLAVYGIDRGTLYRTESLRAMIARETLSGHWLVPTLYQQPFLTKPPGQYIAIALCSLPFGEVTTVSARLPSVFAFLVCCYLCYTMLRSIRSQGESLVGVILFTISFWWLDKVPSAEIDMLQTMWVMLALASFFWGYQYWQKGSTNPDCLYHAHKSMKFFTLALVATTAGFLTKWTAPAFFYLCALFFLWRQRELRWFWSRFHLVPLAIAAALVGLWLFGVSQEVDLGLLWQMIYQEAEQRLNPAHQHEKIPWFGILRFPVLVLLSGLPWSFFIARNLVKTYRQRYNSEKSIDDLNERADTHERTDPIEISKSSTLQKSLPDGLRECTANSRVLISFLNAWVWPNLLFWSLMSQQRLRYVLPIIPALILLGLILMLTTIQKRGSSSLSKVFVAGVIIWLGIRVVYVEQIVAERSRKHHARETAQQLRENIPENTILYIDQLKDEGLLFYYQRPVLKWNSKIVSLPKGQDSIRGQTIEQIEAEYILLREAEWREWCQREKIDALIWLRDQQNDPIVLVKRSAVTNKSED